MPSQPAATAAPVRRMLSVERHLGPCLASTVFVGSGTPATAARSHERATSRARSSTPMGAQPTVWRQHQAASVPSAVSATSAASAAPAPMATPVLSPSPATSKLQPRVQRVARGQPPPPVTQRLAGQDANATAPAPTTAASEAVPKRVASVRSSARSSSPGDPDPAGGSGLSEVQHARSLSSHALAVLNDELQRISTGWNSTREAFQRRADGISAELDEQQRERASQLGELRNFQSASLELIKRLSVATTPPAGGQVQQAQGQPGQAPQGQGVQGQGQGDPLHKSSAAADAGGGV
mmetsp:Transcript_37729/g.87627  ORF Transcript_37729/g.87627 Transcript_37729/m.87627 type:complete len:295 (+) Transcript_37729:3-887(+)